MGEGRGGQGRGVEAEPARPQWRPERVFVLLALIFGTAFVIVTPPFDAPDERRHLGRAWAISEGRLSVPGQVPGQGIRLPAALLALHPEPYDHRCKHDAADLWRALGAGFDPEERVDAVAVTTPYAPLAYLPQAGAIALGRGLGLSGAALLYLGRFANLACWVALVAWALRMTPRRRWALVVLALAPMSTFLAGSLTADAMTTAFAFVFVSLVLRASAGDGAGEPASRRELATLAIAAASLALAKPGYWPLAGLVGLVPARRFRDTGIRLGWLAGVGALVLLPSAVWIWITQSVEPVPLGSAADPASQVRGMLMAPWLFAGAVLRTFAIEWIPWTAGFVGVLGKLDAPLPLFVYGLYPAALVALCLWDAPDSPSQRLLSRGERRGVAGLFVICVLSILALAYVGWNPVGAPVIADVHGRYFLPVAPLVMLAIPPRRSLPARAPLGVGIFCAGVLALSLWAVIRRFYVL